jgi:hypothetical protein
MTRNGTNDTRLVHHMAVIFNTGSAVTTSLFTFQNLANGPSLTVNPIFPSAARLRAVALHTTCLVVNSAGDWTFRLYVNESGSTSFTGTFPVPAATATGKTVLPGNGIILNAGSTYHIDCTGPSRNVLAVRAVLEWEIL